VGYQKTWLRIAKLGDLPADVTPHVLRHSFAAEERHLGHIVAGPFSRAAAGVL
jgi:hypothetical protein